MKVLTFDTTHHALLAEQVAHDAGLAAEIMPAPATSRAKCDLALAFLPEEEATLLTLLTEAAVEYRVWADD